MRINEAHHLLDAWAVRMAPANPPYRRPAVKDEWTKRLELYPQQVARAAWNAWLEANPRRFPNLYELDRLLTQHGNAGQETDQCDQCDGTGWTEAPSFVNNGHTYSAVEPCTCRNGEQRRNTRVWKERNG